MIRFQFLLFLLRCVLINSVTQENQRCNAIQELTSKLVDKFAHNLGVRTKTNDLNFHHVDLGSITNLVGTPARILVNRASASRSFQGAHLESTTLTKARCISDFRSQCFQKSSPPRFRAAQHNSWSVCKHFREAQILVEASPDASFDSWTSWANIGMNGVQIKYFADGLRGVAASRALWPFTLAASVPENAVLEIVGRKSPTEFPDFVPQDVWDEAAWDQRLAFKLLYESKILGKDSDMHMYIGALPKSFSTPLHWATDSIRQTQCRAFARKVEQQKQRWESLYMAWQRSAAKLAAQVRYEDFVWAMTCATSRSFRAVYVGSKSTERQLLLLLASVLPLLWSLTGICTWEQSKLAFVVMVLSVVLRDAVCFRPGLKRYVMCPVMDMFNHRSNVTANAGFDYFSGRFFVLTGFNEAYNQGDQVYITYGKLGNDKLLQYFGFVEPDNKYDSYDFCGSFPEVFRRSSSALKAQMGELPNKPSSKERLAQLTRMLRVHCFTGHSAGTTAAKQVSPQGSYAMKNTTRFFACKGWDEVTVRCMRAMCASSAEWRFIFGTNGDLSNLKRLGIPLSVDTERKCTKALRILASCELAIMPSTLQDDLKALASMRTSGALSVDGAMKTESNITLIADAFGSRRAETLAAMAFRIENKKLLHLASR